MSLTERYFEKAAKAVARTSSRAIKLKISLEREEDGRWIADITNLPGRSAGCAVYGATRSEAINNVKSSALFTLSCMGDESDFKVPSKISFQT
jgi:predicted RNase H-like HicB family nuclease